jgi:tetratricopeptide (TPR) repeat protein
MKNSRFIALVLTGWLGLHVAGGCGIVSKPEPWTADVTIDGQMFPIEASGNDHSRKGVSSLRAEQWKPAIDELELAVQANPDDENSWKALGVAYDKQGDARKAYDAYTKANILVRSPDPLVIARLLKLKPLVEH